MDTVTIGGDISVGQIGYGAMRIVGQAGSLGNPGDREASLAGFWPFWTRDCHSSTWPHPISAEHHNENVGAAATDLNEVDMGQLT
ncbi:MAG: hypothetical protein WA991_00620 [Ornithinimicrobium sp.]